MNLAPVRGSYLESYCGASPANDMRPLQVQKRESMSTGGRSGRAPILEYEPLSGAAAPQPPCYLVKNRAEISLNFEYPSFKILQKIFPDNQKVVIYF